MTSYTLPESGRRGGKLLPSFVDFDELAVGPDDYSSEAFQLSGWASKGNRISTPAATGPDAGYAKSQTAAAASSKGPSSTQIAAVATGMLADAYSKFHAVEMAQIETRGQADFQRHRAKLLELDYRSAFQRAEAVLQQGQAEAGVRGLQGAQQRAEITASMAARGIEASGANVAEVLRAEALTESIDVYHINLAAVRANRAAREDAVRIENEQRFARVSERNLRRTARYAMPEAALIGGLLNAGSAGYGLSGGA